MQESVLVWAVPGTNDRPHRGRKIPKKGIVIVLDREKIFTRGKIFTRHDFSTTLYLNSWPRNLTVRDSADGFFYTVVGYVSAGTDRQKLVSICGTVELVPTHNGGLNRHVVT